jgi:hypothetical protein
MGRGRAVLVAVAVALAGAAGAAGSAELETRTADWIVTAPDSLGTQADLDLVARATQLCTDEVKLLVGRRPANVERFTMTWTPAAGGSSYATQTGIVNLAPPGYRLLEPSTRPFVESYVGRGRCFGPHEVAHVLTWESWGQAWANEGFATFLDRLYESTSWSCCEAPVTSRLACDETGYTLAGERFAYTDLRSFAITTRHYHTAACFWLEVHRLGGFPTIRAVLASMRARRPRTTGEFAVQHVNPILGADLRPVLGRYGFGPADLQSEPRPPGPLPCTRIGTARADRLVGTAGADRLCGLAGADRLDAGAGRDVLEGGAGADTVSARDRVRDTIRCGAGRDLAVVDRVDAVARDCERVRRP